MIWPQIVHTWMYGGMQLERIAQSLAASGADGADLSIDLRGEKSPQGLLRQNIRGIFALEGLQVYAASALCSDHDIDPSSNNSEVREKALTFLLRALDVTAHAGCDRMLVSPSWVSVSHQFHTSRDEDAKRAADTIAQAATYAATLGITVMIEPINRYRVALVHTVAEALAMRDAIGLPNVAIVPDTYHMQVEELCSLPEALRSAGEHLACLHIGDSGRSVPGMGQVDWVEILACLDEIGFTGPLSYEPIELYFDASKVSSDRDYAEAFERRIASGVSYLRGLMSPV
ncbi:MAG: sugar phosphate isomerase/epimerase [Propionibacteriaceae bacterium]|nr:sugar phosphate isomerase/epimerase [Propionibacteriaceae bacterium]